MSNRTFKPRRRALSPTRQRRFEELAPRWVIAGIESFDCDLSNGGELFDYEAMFDNDRPVILDIGIGRGESTIEMATADRHNNIIGVDPHTPGIASVLLAIDERDLSNIRLIHGDIFDQLDRFAPAGLAGLRIYFPDPWPKARHHRRRIVTAERMARLLPLVTDGGFVHLATDIADYADQMIEVCSTRNDLIGGPIDRPDWRPLTRYEQRGQQANRPITDIYYTRCIYSGSGAR